MPLSSIKQRRYLWATNPTLARRFEDHTPKGTKLPMRASDPKPDDTDKRAFAAAFILKCAAAGITDPKDVARVATEMVKRAIAGSETAGSVLGGAGSAALMLPLIGSVVAPAVAGSAVGALGGHAKNKMDEDDAETMRLSAQANAYRRRAAAAAAHDQVRKLLSSDPNKYVVLG